MRAVLVMVAVMCLLSPAANAVLNPAAGRDEASVVVTCKVTETAEKVSENVHEVLMLCALESVVRSPEDHNVPDKVVIHYSYDSAAIEKQFADMQAKVDEERGYAGPGPNLPPVLPNKGDTINAYLNPVPGTSEGREFYVPAAGDYSFEVVTSDENEDSGQ